MKKLVIISAFLLLGFLSKSQEINDSPNSKWPFLFKDFSACNLYYTDGTAAKITANYNLLSEELQFTENGNIMSLSETGKIKEISFTDFTMTSIDGKYYIKINKDGNVINILKKIKGNMNDLMESEGAYGSSTTTASVREQSDIDIGGINSMDVRTLWDKRNEGKNFRINDSYYFTIKNSDEPISLNKRKLLRAFPDRKKEINTYLKENNIGLSNDADTQKLAKFINNEFK